MPSDRLHSTLHILTRYVPIRREDVVGDGGIGKVQARAAEVQQLHEQREHSGWKRAGNAGKVRENAGKVRENAGKERGNAGKERGNAGAAAAVASKVFSVFQPEVPHMTAQRSRGFRR